jgi:MFS family permease
MMAFALLLAGQATTGSFASGAWMASFYAFGAAASAPFRGRALDRVRLPEGLRAPLLQQSALTLAVALACVARAPLPLLLGLSLVLGVLPAGVPGAYRALLPALVPPERLERAFSFDAVLIEVQWILGPALVGVLGLVHPGLSLGVISASALLAALANRRLPSRAPPPAPPPGGPRPSLAPFLHGLPRLVYLSVIVNGVSWGAVDAAIPALLPQLGSRAEAWGGLAALLSGTSAVGGLVYAGVTRPASREVAVRRALLFLALWGGLLLPLPLMASYAGLAVWLGAAGLFLAPLVALLTYLLQQALPSDRQAEGFALYSAGWALGIGVGSALAAVLLEHAHARAALVPAGALPLLLAAGLGLARLGLTPAEARARAPDAGAGAP